MHFFSGHFLNFIKTWHCSEKKVLFPLRSGELLGSINGVNRICSRCCAGTNIGVAAWQTVLGTSFIWSEPRWSLSTWMRFLSGLLCLTAAPCAGMKWEGM